MVELGHYRHFKGQVYEVIAIGKHTETLEDMVVYKALSGNQDIWVRPASMWIDTIDRDGKIFVRFEKIEEVR